MAEGSARSPFAAAIPARVPAAYYGVSYAYATNLFHADGRRQVFVALINHPAAAGDDARKVLDAIEAVIGGQGVGLFSDVLVGKALAAGTLVKAFDLSLPGYRFYVVRRRDHPREKQIRAFASWLKSAT